MFNAFERMVAWRYLRAKKSESFVSVIVAFSFLGIMLGVATLIIVMSVMNGFRAELVNRILGLNGHINIVALQNVPNGFDALTKDLEKLPDVVQANAVIERQALLSIKDGATGVIVRGISKDSFERKPILKNALISGNFDQFEGRVLAIGIELARAYNLSIGDSIEVISPQVKSTPFGSVPRRARFTISQIFDVNMYEYNQGFVFMPLDSAQLFFNLKDKISYIEIQAKDAENLQATKNQLIQALRGDGSLRDWRQTNGSFFNALEVERNVMFLILTLIIIVAAFNIISSMIMMVKDKTSDIAIMRTMGASKSSMLKIFILNGAIIGVVGTLAGTALGVSFAFNIESIRQFLEGLTGTELFSAEIYFLSQLPALVEWSEVLSVVAMALFLSFGATLYPAWKAAKTDPVEVLRYG